MKFNWGFGLIIFFACYISYLVYVVVKSSTIDHSLVLDNYYELDINYQDKYDQIKNGLERSNALNVQVEEKSGQVSLDFGSKLDRPTDLIEGKVTFYRSSNKQADFTQDFKVGSDGKYLINSSTLNSGKWSVQVTWTEGGKMYYHEDDVFLMNQ